MTNSRTSLRRSCWLLLPLVSACIDVGHDAEVGCLVDMKEPGCHATGGTTGGRVSTGGRASTGGSAGRAGSSTGGTAGANEAGSANDAGSGGVADTGAGGDSGTLNGGGGSTS